MRRLLRRHLAAKLFLSYLTVILVGIVILASAAEFVVPSAFERHLAAMGSMMQQMMGGGMMTEMMGLPADVDLNADLYRNFRAAVTEALALASVAAGASAIVVSLFVSRQVVRPIQAMSRAAERIAEGDYEERVQVPGDPASGDLDELGQLALRFNRMAARLAQTEAMRRQLIGDVSHELRTPLTVIKGMLEGLMDGVLPPTEETYQQIHREASRLQRLVDDLQELSRVEAQAYELQRRLIPPRDLIARAEHLFRPQFEDKGITFEIQIADDLPPVLADEDRIHQVLTNLLGNALQYTPSGGRVTLTVERTAKGVRFQVQDTGKGIPPEHLPHIFDRFYRVDKSRSRAHGGSGIGLTIARHLIEAHGGRIWAESAGRDQGSTFAFTLPSA